VPDKTPVSCAVAAQQIAAIKVRRTGTDEGFEDEAERIRITRMLLEHGSIPRLYHHRRDRSVKIALVPVGHNRAKGCPI
jgi:hypothetical protein